MRVIAGRLKGRRLASVRAAGLRPTSDRVREAMFDILGDTSRGARVLDLYAGTGALAIEAVSRGAAGATCVERDRRALTVLSRNVAALGLEAEVRIVRADALDYCRRNAEDEAFDMILCDPPYAIDPSDVVERIVAAPCWSTVCVIEHAAARPLPRPLPVPVDTRRYGDTALSFFWRR